VTSAQPVTVGVHGDSGAGKPSIPEMITIPSAVEAIVQEMITDPIESRVIDAMKSIASLSHGEIRGRERYNLER
jgi:hypothetical protein